MGQGNYEGRHTPETGPRYYCRGADGPNGHCDNQPMTIQCCYCIWKEQQEELKSEEYTHTNT